MNESVWRCSRGSQALKKLCTRGGKRYGVCSQTGLSVTYAARSQVACEHGRRNVMKLVGQAKMRFFGYFLLFMKKKGGEFLLAIIHSARRFYACNWRKKTIVDHTKLWMLWVPVTTDLARHPHWCNSGINIMGITNHFLAGLKPH